MSTLLLKEERLKKLFVPGPPLQYIHPGDHAPAARKTTNIDGIAQYLPQIEAYKAQDAELEWNDSVMEKARQHKERKLNDNVARIQRGISQYDPKSDPKIKGNAYRTLFVARLPYAIKESELEREFERYGRIEHVRIVHNTKASADATDKKKHRGYGFIVYRSESDFKDALANAKELRMHGRHILVDFEHGRTVDGWKPRRLGGGLGGRHYTQKPAARLSYPSGYSAAPSGPRGGRGGARGYGYGGRGGAADGFRGRGPPPSAPYGSRGGVGFAPEGAPAGPRGPREPRDSRGGGYGSSNGYYGSGGPSRPDDRGVTGSNSEPVRPRERGGPRDRDGPYDRREERREDRGGDYPRRREYDGGYDDSYRRRY